MSTLELNSLRQTLKEMIVKECDKDVAPESIGDDDPLLGGGALRLDSLDALQICLAVKDRWDVRIEGGMEARKALTSVTTLAQTIIDARAPQAADSRSAS
jgi:acyl carrier protein